jgi:hypothetical protein
MAIQNRLMDSSPYSLKEMTSSRSITNRLGGALSITVIPCLKGTTMGGLIRRDEFEIPYLEEQVRTLRVYLKNLESTKSEILMSATQGNRVIFQRKLVWNFKEKNRVNERIKELKCKLKEARTRGIEFRKFGEHLFPIDWQRTKCKVEIGGSESENFRYIILQSQSGESRVNNERLKDFKNHCKSLEPSNSESFIDEIGKKALDQVNATKQEVCVLFSFVTLSKVRRLDPILVSRGARLPKELQRNAREYSVIAETVLGGTFVGFGSRVGLREGSSSDLEASRFSCISFRCQGAIPGDQTFDLWETYRKWKRLISDVNSTDIGFPIGYKIRDLTDVLEENGIKVEESEFVGASYRPFASKTSESSTSVGLKT